MLAGWPRSAASSPALEHPDPAAGAKRVFLGGALFGLGILLAHAIAGTDAKVSLGGFPPLLILIDAIIGAVLGAIGGAISRSRRATRGLTDALAGRSGRLDRLKKF